MRLRHVRRNGFTLVELVVVIVIIGILAAVAIPRFSRGSAGASQVALQSNLAVIRKALHTYAAEHDGKYPQGADSAAVTRLLVEFSNRAGDATVKVWDKDHPFGPYLDSLPPAPVGENAGSSAILVVATDTLTVTTAGGEGWIYSTKTGEFRLNSEQDDGSGKKYNEY